MKLFTQTIIYVSISIFLIIGIWAFGFYYNMLDEIKESIDEGLEHYKRQIIYNALEDSMLLKKNKFDEGFFAIQEVSKIQAMSAKDRYIDTILLMQDEDDEDLEEEPVRMLSTAFENNGQYYELKVFNSMVEEGDLINELFWKSIWLYLILLAGIVIINQIVVQRLWNPFYHFLNQLKKYRLGSSKKLPEVKTSTQEFQDLQNAVIYFLKQNLSTYEQQKQFIGNVTHELQTPLAIATNKLEMMVEKGGLEEVQVTEIDDILNIIDRLVRLNKSLLLLTKIENHQFHQHQTISVNNIVRQCIDDLNEYVDFKNIKISIQETAELSVSMDPALAQIVVSNLIRNAVFHNIENGLSEIKITANKFSVCNSGIPEPLDEAKIFTRFFKSGTASAGTGLGLAIVKAICSLYEFTPSYHFENQQHCFSIRFNNF